MKKKKYKDYSELAIDPYTPPETLIELSNSPNYRVRALVAQNPFCPIEALIKLSKDKDWTVNFNVTQNSRWINFMIEKAKDSMKTELENEKILALSSKASVEELNKLSKHKNKHIRYYVAQNPNTSIEALITLSEDHTWMIRNAVAKNPKCPKDIVDRLSGHKKEPQRSSMNFTYKLALAKDPNTLVEMLEKLSRDESDEIKCAVALNPSTPDYLLRKLTQEEIEDKFRSLEKEYKRHTDKNKFLVFRADGKGFSKWTGRDLNKPFDKRFSELMKKVAYKIGTETEARSIFVVSDEISFVYEPDKHPYAGSHQKIVSLLPAMISVEFTLGAHKDMGLAGSYIFDGRILEVPTIDDANEVLNWRRNDGIRNSVQMLARSLYSHSQLEEKSSKEMKRMIEEKGASWYAIEDEFKWGTQWDRTEETRIFSSKEIEELPPLHNARQNPNLEFKRTLYKEKKRNEKEIHR